MEEGGKGTSKGLAPSQADGLVAKPGDLLISAYWHRVSFMYVMQYTEGRAVTLRAIAHRAGACRALMT